MLTSFFIISFIKSINTISLHYSTHTDQDEGGSQVEKQKGYCSYFKVRPSRKLIKSAEWRRGRERENPP